MVSLKLKTPGSANSRHRFGNLVTMDWWSELWLNEGFATWVGWLAIDHFHPGTLDRIVGVRMLMIYRLGHLGTVPLYVECPEVR